MPPKKIDIKWQIRVKKISELKPLKYNPRNITEKGLKELTVSIDKFGLAEPIVINTDNVIIGGHARYFALKQKGETKAQCYVPDKKLTKKQVDELNIRLNKNIAGEWDFDILANDFELKDLLDWGFQEYELGVGEDFNPVGIDEQGKLDEKKKAKCPECGCEFEPS